MAINHFFKGIHAMTKTRLLIVEDDEDIRTQMKWALGSDYEVLT